MLDRLGFEPKPGEEPQWDPVRAGLLSALGIPGNDPEVIAFCRRSAELQCSRPRAVRGDAAGAALAVASWHGDKKWFDRVRQAFESADAPDLRARFLLALAAFADPATARAGLDYLLTDPVRSTEVLPALSSAEPEQAPLLFEWIQDHYAAIKAKVSESFLPFLPGVLGVGDERLLERGRAFFLDPGRATRMTEVEFKKAAEAVELRAALRKRNGPALWKYLSLP
jgi:hypothetical protein